MDDQRPPPIDVSTQPQWQRTGYMFFPYAAQVAGRWWVLRANYCFPAHDLCTVFIDGRAVANVTASADDPLPLAASIAALQLITPGRDTAVPVMAAELAETVVAQVADYVVYGSEANDPCDLCELADRDPYARSDRRCY